MAKVLDKLMDTLKARESEMATEPTKGMQMEMRRAMLMVVQMVCSSETTKVL
jgi:hypothetical protein